MAEVHNYRPVWWFLLIANVLQVVGLIIDHHGGTFRIALVFVSAICLIVVTGLLLSGYLGQSTR
ncbi:MAG: hypothetical protein ACREDR_48660 [Blastocatellia bacterium]